MTYDLIIQIIKILLSNKTYISVSNIADKTNVSTKTIYNYLEKHSFLEYIYPCTLEKRQKQGVRILGNEQALNKLKQKLSIYRKKVGEIIFSHFSFIRVNSLSLSTFPHRAQYNLVLR